MRGGNHNNGLRLDTSALRRGLDLANKKVRRGARRAVAKLMAHAERRAKGHFVPVRSGTLAGTIRSGVEDTAAGLRGVLTAGGGEAADYAVRQHEEELVHRNPQSGRFASKYIEKPLTEVAQKAPAVIAAEVKRELAS